MYILLHDAHFIIYLFLRYKYVITDDEEILILINSSLNEANTWLLKL